MGPTDAIKTCIDKFIAFSGRASRPEFWWFAALFIAINVFLNLFDIGGLGTLIWLALLVPFLAVTWRRMHDAGNTGALILLPMLIMIASIYVALFQISGPVMAQMAQLEINPDMTLRELQSQQQAIINESGVEQRYPVTPLSFIILAIGTIWMIYLLARPSQPQENIYGPNPNEVPS
jgi:uncharacterized membrane protein YhaH (DUF805 family)